MKHDNDQSIEGTVFNIQRFSLNDGPGIRTTAFLKGCPLHCRWCHNPESMLPAPELLFDRDACMGCGACIPVCPEKAIRKSGDRIQITDACNHCGACVPACPERALELSGRTMTAEAVAAELARDRLFYEESNGGITLSGGEPLAQPEFTTAILRLCKQLGLHTALDTTCFAEREVIDAVIPCVDLFLVDLKHPDSTVHEAYTDAPNELIIENLRHLCARGCDVLVRQPLVPGFNDARKTVEATGRLLTECGVKRFEILEYHALGRGKRKKLIRPVPELDFKSPTKEQMLEIRSILGKFPFQTISGDTK